MLNSPNPEERVASLLQLLAVQPLGDGRFLGPRKPRGTDRVFGGQMIAQALAAARQTVTPDRIVHSLHAYFLRGASEEHTIDFRVERDLDGRNFSNRRVVASQNGKPILSLSASFQTAALGISHQDRMPDVPGPEGLTTEADLWKEYQGLVIEPMRSTYAQPNAIDLRPTNKMHWIGLEKGPPRMAAWVKTSAPLPDDPSVHRTLLAYISDYLLLATCMVPHGANWTTGHIRSASLDHAIWFHDDLRADEWLLHEMDSPWAGNGRGFNRGRIFTRDGHLVAEVAQEGIVRSAHLD